MITKDNNTQSLWKQLQLALAVDMVVDRSATDEHISQSIEEVIESFLGEGSCPDLIECLTVVVREYQKHAVKFVLESLKEL